MYIVPAAWTRLEIPADWLSLVILSSARGHITICETATLPLLAREISPTCKVLRIQENGIHTQPGGSSFLAR